VLPGSGDFILLNTTGGLVTRVFDSWSDERVTFLRSSAADIKNRAAALGQWRTAFDCSYLSWSTARTS
jgi:hypothetical protein